jgi:hypothetical protein
MLGVLCILETPVDWHALVEMASAIHRRATGTSTAIPPLPVASVVGAGSRMSAGVGSTTGTMLQP